MAERIDRTLIQHVAQLASLSLTEAEGVKMTGEIAAILKYVGELETLDTSDVPPTAYIQLGREGAPQGAPPGQASWRADHVEPSVSHDRALAQAPRAAQGGFAVPGFVESES
jgi:aspartyl-tRNA(Asn)/glutamyl-tRNA(Gln) amidotransferase subunit C